MTRLLLLLPCILLAQNPAHEWFFMDSTQQRIVLETRDYGAARGYAELGAHAAYESRGDTAAINPEDPNDPYAVSACELQVSVRIPTEDIYGKDFTTEQFEAVKDSLIVFREF